ncbi:MAG: hypothetical protein AB7O04_05190 [Hyphomonadaceae bacterium]
MQTFPLLKGGSGPSAMERSSWTFMFAFACMMSGALGGYFSDALLSLGALIAYFGAASLAAAAVAPILPPELSDDDA